MKKHIQNRKLRLSSETLRRLTVRQLAQAAGGGGEPADDPLTASATAKCQYGVSAIVDPAKTL